ncbi:hypothetical protein HRbin12_01465 [bacterium HR12]|nr:hypothetical protein HRbin12_01465 [bacterium HR12]
MRCATTGSPVRIAVPVGPRPRGSSAQVRSIEDRYPASNPAQATGSTLRRSSSRRYPTQAIRYPPSSTTIRQISRRSSRSSRLRSIAWLQARIARRVRFRWNSSLSIRRRVERSDTTAARVRPSGPSSAVSAISTGTSEPSRRRAVSSRRPSIPRGVGSWRNRSTKPAYRARSGSGTSSSRRWPTRAPGSYPKIDSAAGFAYAIRPSGSNRSTPFGLWSMKAWSRSSTCRARSWAALLAISARARSRTAPRTSPKARAAVTATKAQPFAVCARERAVGSRTRRSTARSDTRIQAAPSTA